MPDSYYDPPEFKCDKCGGDDDTCRCCIECEQEIEDCECDQMTDDIKNEVLTEIIVSVRLEKTMHNHLKELAEHHERTVSQLVRFAIRDYLKNGANK